MKKILMFIISTMICFTMSACQQEELEYFPIDAQVPMPQNAILISNESSGGYTGYVYSIESSELYYDYIELLEKNNVQVVDGLQNLATGKVDYTKKLIYVNSEFVGYLSRPSSGAGYYTFIVMFEE